MQEIVHTEIPSRKLILKVSIIFEISYTKFYLISCKIYLVLTTEILVRH